MKTHIMLLVSGLALAAAPAIAAKDEAAIPKCAAPAGTVAVIDGDTQGWSKMGLGSPRELLTAMIAESNCFTIHDPASGPPADYLLSAIAGDKAEVAQGVNIAKAALTEGAVRSGALGAVANVPFAGAALRMFGGFGGKKRTVSAGLRLISPQSGQTLLSGSGEAKKTTLSWGGLDGGYGSTKEGKLLGAAFAEAYGTIAAQAGTLGGNAAKPAK
jgi:hypothetical protein